MKRKDLDDGEWIPAPLRGYIVPVSIVVGLYVAFIGMAIWWWLS